MQHKARHSCCLDPDGVRFQGLVVLALCLEDHTKIVVCHEVAVPRSERLFEQLLRLSQALLLAAAVKHEIKGEVHFGR